MLASSIDSHSIDFLLRAECALDSSWHLPYWNCGLNDVQLHVFFIHKAMYLYVFDSNVNSFLWSFSYFLSPSHTQIHTLESVYVVVLALALRVTIIICFLLFYPSKCICCQNTVNWFFVAAITICLSYSLTHTRLIFSLIENNLHKKTLLETRIIVSAATVTWV